MYILSHTDYISYRDTLCIFYIHIISHISYFLDFEDMHFLHLKIFTFTLKIGIHFITFVRKKNTAIERGICGDTLVFAWAHS